MGGHRDFDRRPGQLSRGHARRFPPLLQISPEGQKQARALGDAFNAVAEYVKPSVVQISVQQQKIKSGAIRIPGAFLNDPNHNLNPKEIWKDMLKRFFGPNGRFEKEQQFGGLAEGTGSGFVYRRQGPHRHQ